MKYLLLLLLLSACTTPLTTLKKGDQIVDCGGNVSSSLGGGVIGYHIQKGNDEECVERYKKYGYKVQYHEAN